MVMVDGCEQVADVHDPMPAILRQEDWTTCSYGTPDEAFGLLQTWDGPMIVDRTDEAWAAGRTGNSKAFPTLRYECGRNL